MAWRNSVLQASPRTGRSSGFTVLELLVGIGVVSLLMSLLLPAAVHVREISRRTQCLNRLRQLALAMTAHDSTFRRLPASGNFSARGPEKFHSWVTSILPQIDQSALLNPYRMDLPFDSPENLPLTRNMVESLVCPDDISVEPGEGNLSYVVNCGLSWTIPVDCPGTLHAAGSVASVMPLDLNGNGVICPLDPQTDGAVTDIALMQQSSVFFVENWPLNSGTVRHHDLGDLTDGTSQTIMISENVRAGFDPQTKSTWGSPDPRYNSFFVSSLICRDERCAAGQVDLRRANDRHDPVLRREALNGALTQPEGLAPWPSSMHPGLVNMAFADGHATALSEDINGATYFALVTPQGGLNPAPLDEPVLGGGEF